jgi:hypothetical protein
LREFINKFHINIGLVLVSGEGFCDTKNPRVRDGRGSRLVGELAEPPATTAVAKPGQPDLPVWIGGLVGGGRIYLERGGREPPDLIFDEVIQK